jgi:hypothetical protein
MPERRLFRDHALASFVEPLFRKPVSTFRDHALASKLERILGCEVRNCLERTVRPMPNLFSIDPSRHWVRYRHRPCWPDRVPVRLVRTAGEISLAADCQEAERAGLSLSLGRQSVLGDNKHWATISLGRQIGSLVPPAGKSSPKLRSLRMPLGAFCTRTCAAARQSTTRAQSFTGPISAEQHGGSA